ncbi:hypothetical protein BDB00DRAFT_872646 [Zychaea mexicana]|uniref:uncharacterized protein n=1 Tax=Zychaea mexicana TaxID=64656 RepID=UPI0022FE1498|nr:uncharacterized protein BDB00DRAFT_872646 [Zychaea mexicana]KAI9493132.1 hypothetical protein BDB00DRAFT_872646 [Zychaea mexicana]
MVWPPFTKNLKIQVNNNDKNHVIDIVGCFKKSNLIEREKAEAQFKAEVTHMSEWKPSKVRQWNQQQVENDYSILSSGGYEEYWRAIEIDKKHNEAEAAETKSYYQTRKDSAKRSHGRSKQLLGRQKQATTQQNSSTPAATTTAQVDYVPQGATATVDGVYQKDTAGDKS